MSDFFDKLKKGLDEGLTKVKVKSKHLVDSTKIKGEISNLNQRKSALLLTLGTEFYDMYKSGTFVIDKFKDKFNELENIEKQIELKEKELEELDKAAEEIIGKQSPKLKKCSCGAELPIDAKFCTSCGSKLD
ncbi:MAG: zinc ribbon domain-containing protein [Ignavibacteria bacterium]|nr:zinc ribbon domain-containing protein [Ignavibacteria bacterium]